MKPAKNKQAWKKWEEFQARLVLEENVFFAPALQTGPGGIIPTMAMWEANEDLKAQAVDVVNKADEKKSPILGQDGKELTS